ncbi:uncharacterized protein LOC113312831 [Papaver somniferum]|uniref:uncharacterized protein LOC113312831 n=1 Tax=Papaver somniferum TaxID=3469 RepID=UPI000E703257|nr:uncharacterized protein LOC113312831 [Papaver somniferum]
MRRGEGTSAMMQQEQEQILQQETIPPVLAAKRKPMKVLVAIDDSEGSFYALKWALDNLFTYGAASSTEPNQTQNFGMMYLLNNVSNIFNTTSFLLALEGMICQADEQMHADILVVGSRDLGKTKRAFLEIVIDYCAHHAKCPILIVKPPQ